MNKKHFSTETIKKIATGILIILVVLAVSLWQYSDKSSKQSVLEESLDLLGDKLLAMVPAGNSKATLTEVYNNFKQKAIAGLVGEQEVEQVAANILNASNNETELTPRQAEAIIVGEPYMSMQSGNWTPRTTDDTTWAIPPKPPKGAPSSALPPDFGERIIAMVHFNDQMAASFKRHNMKINRIGKHMRFRADKGLRIEMDSAIRDQLPAAEFEVLGKELVRMENLEWCDNLAEEIEMEISIKTAEIESLHVELMQEHHQEIERALEELDELKHLQQLGVDINVDSIKFIIKKQMIEANIPPPPPPNFKTKPKQVE